MSLPMARARRKKVPSIQRSPNSSTRSHSATLSAKPRAVTSQAVCSSLTSQSSLISRISEITRANSPSRDSSRGHLRVDDGRDAAVDAGLAGLPQRAGQLVEVAHLETQRVGDLLQRRAAADPELAVHAVAEELVGVAGGARAGVEDRLAVVDDEHRVGGLVAGEVGVGGVGPEAVVGVVGPHLEGAGREHQPLARERLGELAASRGGVVGDGVRRQVDVAAAPALAHERRVGLGHCRVVRFGRQVGCQFLLVCHG